MAVLLLELVLRIGSGLMFPALYELDTKLGWVHTPSVSRTLADEDGRVITFATDARGLRATLHVEPRNAARKRVLFVGDSFTQGSQVEADELFTRRVERALPEIEAWNLGVGGYSTLQELRALQPRLATLAPDLVVLVVFENDFVDNLMPYFSGLGPRPHLVVRGAEVVEITSPDVEAFRRFLMPTPGAFWCYEHLALYRTLHKNLFLPAAGDRLAALEHAERAAVPLAQQHQAMQWSLTQFQQVLTSAGARLLVAAIPTHEAAAVGPAASHVWLADHCRSAALPFVSLLEALRDPQCYFRNDIHLTAAGHAAVASALAPAVAAALRH